MVSGRTSRSSRTSVVRARRCSAGRRPGHLMRSRRRAPRDRLREKGSRLSEVAGEVDSAQTDCDITQSGGQCESCGQFAQRHHDQERGAFHPEDRLTVPRHGGFVAALAEGRSDQGRAGVAAAPTSHLRPRVVAPAVGLRGAVAGVPQRAGLLPRVWPPAGSMPPRGPAGAGVLRRCCRRSNRRAH